MPTATKHAACEHHHEADADHSAPVHHHLEAAHHHDVDEHGEHAHKAVTTAHVHSTR